MATEYLPLGCYGKLPFWPEYLEENLSYPTSRALKQWTHEGRHEASLTAGGETEQPSEPRETMSRRFLCGLPGSTELVAGVIRPSTDQGGLRPYPFMALTHFPRRHYGKSYPLLPLGLGPVWDALDDAWDTLSGVTSRTAFREILASIRIPFPEDVSIAKGHYQGGMRESAGRIFERQDGASLAALKRHFPEFIAQLKKGPEAPGLELPVSGDIEAAAFDVAFWIESINHQFLWKRFEPSVFLEASLKEKNRDVVLVFGMIRARDYPPILGCGGSANDLVRPAHLVEGGVAAGSPEGNAVDYADLLKSLSNP